MAAFRSLMLEEGRVRQASSGVRQTSLVNQGLAYMDQPASSETRLSKDLPTQTPSETAKLLSWLGGEEKGLHSGVTEPRSGPHGLGDHFHSPCCAKPQTLVVEESNFIMLVGSLGCEFRDMG